MSVAVASGGNGNFRDGVYDFCVAVLFNATPAQLAAIRAKFTEGNRVFADALDGQQRFGTITIVNDCTIDNKCGSLEVVEFWILPGGGRAYATSGTYGERNEHVVMYFDQQIGSDGFTGDETCAHTIAHEMIHHAPPKRPLCWRAINGRPRRWISSR